MAKKNTKEVKMILTGKGCKTTSHVLAVLVKILEIIVMIGAVASVVAGVLFAFGQYSVDSEIVKKSFADSDMPIAITGVEEMIDNFFAKPEGVRIAIVLGICVAAAALLFMVATMFKYAYRFFKNLTHDRTPFSLENVDYLQKMATWLFASLILSLVIEIVAPLVFGTGKISLSIPVSSFAVGFVMLVLAVVFRHGYELEQKIREKK